MECNYMEPAHSSVTRKSNIMLHNSPSSSMWLWELGCQTLDTLKWRLILSSLPLRLYVFHQMTHSRSGVALQADDHDQYQNVTNDCSHRRQIYFSPNNTRATKLRRARWIQHVECMQTWEAEIQAYQQMKTVDWWVGGRDGTAGTWGKETVEGEEQGKDGYGGGEGENGHGEEGGLINEYGKVRRE